MVELTDAQLDAAEERGAAVARAEPRARAVRYDPDVDRIVIDLSNGCTFAFPPKLAQGLRDAAPSQLAAVEILGAGTGLHWGAIDVDFSVPGLLSGIFGTRAYMASVAGRATSPAKAAAARANGARGGRPPKQQASSTVRLSAKLKPLVDGVVRASAATKQHSKRSAARMKSKAVPTKRVRDLKTSGS